MSKDDFSVLACKLLAYLYGCLKAGVKANARKAKDVVGCNDLYWEALLDDMSECGLIRVTATHASGKRYVSISEIRITMPGAEYYDENSTMRKVRDTLGSVLEEAVAIAVSATSLM